MDESKAGSPNTSLKWSTKLEYDWITGFFFGTKWNQPIEALYHLIVKLKTLPLSVPWGISAVASPGPASIAGGIHCNPPPNQRREPVWPWDWRKQVVRKRCFRTCWLVVVVTGERGMCNAKRQPGSGTDRDGSCLCSAVKVRSSVTICTGRRQKITDKVVYLNTSRGTGDNR